MADDQEDDAPPAWDEGLAANAPGKYVLIGITHMNAAGEAERLSQMHGVVQSADPKYGFTVALRGAREGETYVLPPDPRPFQSAATGEYRLRETGEVVVDPDLIATWILYPPKATDDEAE